MARAPEPKVILRGHRASVSTVAFLYGSNDTLASGDIEGNILLWSIATKRVAKAFTEAHTGGVLSITANPLDKRWMSQGRIDGSIKLWHEDDLVDVVRTESESFCKAFIQWKPEDKYIVACTGRDEQTLKVWSSDNPRSQTFLKQPEEPDKWGMIMAVQLVDFNEQKYAVIAYEDGMMRMFDIVEANQIPGLTICCQADKNPLTSFVVTKPVDGVAHCIAGGATSTLCAFDVNFNTLEVLNCKTFPAFEPSFKVDEGDARIGKGVGQVSLRPDERICAIASWDNRVRLIHTKTCKHLAVLKHHRESVQTVTFSADSVLLASGSKDQNIALWNIYPPSAT